MLNLVFEGDTVYDVFAGVGPFAIAAAVLKRCRVLANDLNPDCANYLRKNLKINKTSAVQVFNMCGSKFITEIACNDLQSLSKSESKIFPYFSHFF